MIKTKKPITLSTEKLLQIYLIAKKPKEIKYPPARKHYNYHLFG